MCQHCHVEAIVRIQELCAELIAEGKNPQSILQGVFHSGVYALLAFQGGHAFPADEELGARFISEATNGLHSAYHAMYHEMKERGQIGIQVTVPGQVGEA